MNNKNINKKHKQELKKIRYKWVCMYVYSMKEK